MYLFKGYMILLNKEEFEKSHFYNGHCWLEGGIIQERDYPKSYPTCYRYSDFNSYSCGTWYPCDIQEAITSQEKFIQTQENFLKKLKKLLKTP